MSDFQDLTSSSVNKISIGEPESVPAGRYAREVPISLGMYDRLKGKIVFAKDVRHLLAYVET
ncbi:MAG: substrate-binding domain-containing protein [Hormoscilla sp.]